MTYSPGQLEVIVPHLPHAPGWLILGGPADADEAQTARRLWPDIKIVGVEPNPEARAWQLENGWPADCPLLPAALSDHAGEAEVVRERGHVRNASIDADAVNGNRGNTNCIFEKVQSLTLDGLDEFYGPFTDAVVWLDIEGSELAALQGAVNLISKKTVMLWNLEMQNRVPGLMDSVPKLLHGYQAVKDWNASDSCRDRIFVRKDLL